MFSCIGNLDALKRSEDFDYIRWFQIHLLLEWDLKRIRKEGVGMDRFCTQCGQPMEEGMRFCVHCGFDFLSGPETGGPETGGPETGGGDYGREEPFRHDDQIVDKNQQDSSMSGDDYPYNRNNGFNSRKESYSSIPPRPAVGARKKRPVAVIGASLIGVLVLAGCLYFFVFRDQPGDIGIPDNPSSQAEAGGAVSETASEAGQQGLQGADYLPTPGMKLDYYERFIDGTEGPCTRYVAKLSPKIPASEVHIFVDGNNEEFAWVSHYIQKEDGIYIVDDYNVFEHIKVLPAVIREGDTWTREWPEGAMVMTVVAVGVNCELDFTTLKNCVVIHNDNQAVGFDVLQYYAPGMGLVKEESPDGNQVNMEVTAYQQLSAEEAANIVGKHASQVSQLEASIK